MKGLGATDMNKISLTGQSQLSTEHRASLATYSIINQQHLL